jgi:hypothetical protein
MKLIHTYDDHYTVFADDYLFDKPIALLTGPFSISCGDMMPLQMRRHPMVRNFGLGTNSAFGQLDFTDLSSIPKDWIMFTLYSNLSLREEPDLFLNHLNIPPDERIWITREDAVLREDTVVKRALEWIHNLTYSHDVTVAPPYAAPGEMSLHVTAEVENPNDHPISVLAYISNDTMVVDSVYLTQDGAAGDSAWGATWLPTEEDFYHIAVKTDDAVDSTSRTISNVARFTTIGPIEIFYVDYITYPPLPGAWNWAHLILKNKGSSTTAENITATASACDSLILVPSNLLHFSKIAPGDTTRSINKFRIYIDPDHPSKHFPLKAEIARDGYTFWVDSTKVSTPVLEFVKQLPTEFSLSQNYPNPFNPRTIIEYQLPKQCQVDLAIYNLLGQKIASLISEKQPAGNYKYEWNASHVPSGMYLYYLQAGDFVDKKKLVLLK